MEGEVASEITRSSDEDNPVSMSLDLTSDIFNNLATLAEWQTRGITKKGQTYMDSPPPLETDPLETLSLYRLKQTT